jgi:response regulator RpfG family c-di-GMP phosphodiesterase
MGFAHGPQMMMSPQTELHAAMGAGLDQNALSALQQQIMVMSIKQHQSQAHAQVQQQQQMQHQQLQQLQQHQELQQLQQMQQQHQYARGFNLTCTGSLPEAAHALGLGTSLPSTYSIP